MVLRVALFVLMALGLLGFGTVVWISTHPTVAPQVAQAPVAAKIHVLAAARTIRAGSLLKPEDLVQKDYAPGTAPPEATKDTQESRSAMFGAMVRRSLAGGDVIMPQDIMRAGDHGFLAAVLSPGMRAITVSVDAVSGTAGLIWPGDRVDLILLQSRDDSGVSAGHKVGAETVLSDVRVIAIDQHMVQGAAPDNNGQSGRTATLEVTPEQAERVSVAAHIGKLSLTVRAAEPDKDPNAPPEMPHSAQSPVTWANDVSPSLNPSNSQSTTTTMHVYGGSDSKEFKF